ncbi:MAG: CPBP family intramembrane metalloprotease [Labilithrix sp.]|nr:CPBP family intramembrane metalloprotease [Labilithrix sp.]
MLRPAASSAVLDRLAAGPVLVYGALSAVVIGAAIARGHSPVTLGAAEAWLIPAESPALAHGVSVVAGALLAAATISATRHLVRRWSWARALHANLRPAIRSASDGTIVVLGVASAIGEELFFRGLLATTFGLVASSLVFGLLHQMRGRVRWVWAGWATVMGFLFGGLFFATGSLVGPLVAHALINIANLRFLRDNDLEPPRPRRLGGLLGRA